MKKRRRIFCKRCRGQIEFFPAPGITYSGQKKRYTVVNADDHKVHAPRCKTRLAIRELHEFARLPEKRPPPEPQQELFNGTHPRPPRGPAL